MQILDVPPDASRFRTHPRGIVAIPRGGEDRIRYSGASGLRRIENGTHCYTFAEGDHLVHYGWLIERQTRAHFAEVNSDFEYPECSAVLYDFYTDPDARGRGLYQSALRQTVVDAVAIPGTRNVFIFVLADNAPSRVGFQHYASVVRRMRFGVETHAITHVEGA